MTRAEVIAFFPSTPWRPTHLGGTNYAVPTREWLQGPFWEFFRARRWDANLDRWKLRWECRDFARAWASDAQECWALTKGDAAPESDILAVGEFWFLTDPLNPATGHAVGACITDHGREFIDPQNNQLWLMSPAQFSSRLFVRL